MIDSPPSVAEDVTEPAGGTAALPDTTVAKPTTNVWMIASGVLLLLFVGVGLYFYQLFVRQQSVTALTQSLSTGSSEPVGIGAASSQPTAQIEQQPAIQWLTYSNPKYGFLKFQYPEGSVITFKEDVQSPIEGCFTLNLTYQAMKVAVNRLCGIGGMSSLHNGPYNIIAGNEYAGVGKVVTQNEKKQQTEIGYFGFMDGAQQFGDMLVDTASFTVNMPDASRRTYEPIADIMATSVLGQTPNKQESLAKIYQQGESVLGVNPDGTEYVIMKTNASNQERIDTAVINPTGEYLTIAAFIGQGPESYVQFYDLKVKKLLEFAGQSRFPTAGDREVWVSDYVVMDSDATGHYKYDMKNTSRVAVSQAEYEAFISSR